MLFELQGCVGLKIADSTAGSRHLDSRVVPASFGIHPTSGSDHGDCSRAGYIATEHDPPSVEQSRRRIAIPPGAGRYATCGGDTLRPGSGSPSQLLPEALVGGIWPRSSSSGYHYLPGMERSPA